MKIRITQCSVGRYNLLSNEKSFSFYCGIYDDNNNMVTIDDVNASLHYSSEEEESDMFKDLENIGYIFERAYAYSKSIISTRNYEAEARAFAKVYLQNYAEINTNNTEARNKRILREIESLNAQMKYPAIPDITYEIKNTMNSAIKSDQKMVDHYSDELSQVIEGSERYQKISGYLSDYSSKLENKKELITLVNETEENFSI